jgi:hypothetical protein
MFPSRKDCFLQSPYVHMNIHMWVAIKLFVKTTNIYNKNNI